MTWDILWDDEALKEAERLDRRTRERILRAVERLAATGYGDVKRLRGRSGDFRLRVGSWRLRFVFERETRTIHVLHVRPRGNAYRD